MISRHCPRTSSRLATLLDGAGDPERALDARARALDAGCLTAAEEIPVRFHLGARWQRAGRAREALLAYERVLALAPEHVGALVNRGYLRLPVDGAGARADFTRALALAPRNQEARAGLARLAAASTRAPPAGRRR
jgi:tetratricopeptide (TPR) repeat protein